VTWATSPWEAVLGVASIGAHRQSSDHRVTVRTAVSPKWYLGPMEPFELRKWTVPAPPSVPTALISLLHDESELLAVLGISCQHRTNGAASGLCLGS